MNESLIMSFSLKEHSLYNRENNTSIKGSWLYDLAKKYQPNNADEHISLFGLDELKRIEIIISVFLFEKIKNDPVFIMKAENLRRLRSDRIHKSKTILEYMCYPISDFDNDLDILPTQNQSNNR